MIKNEHKWLISVDKSDRIKNHPVSVSHDRFYQTLDGGQRN